MIIILIILQTGCALCEKRLKRSFGVMLLSTYLLVTCIGYV
jgi:Ca2+/Na+ antiporter